MGRTRHLLAGAAVGIAAIAVGDATAGAAEHRVRATGAVLTGRAEAPGPGDTDGFGAAGVVIDTERGRLCYFVWVRNIDAATMAHIHRGGRGTPGPVAVDFEAPSDGSSSGCTTTTRAGFSIADIAANPSDYYVNVHNAAFPGGAVRGQLH